MTACVQNQVGNFTNLNSESNAPPVMIRFILRPQKVRKRQRPPHDSGCGSSPRLWGPSLKNQHHISKLRAKEKIRNVVVIEKLLRDFNFL